MPSKNMLPKGKRRQSVRAEYRKQRTLREEQDAEARARAEAAFESPEQQANELIETADFYEPELTLEERIASNQWITTEGAMGGKVVMQTITEPRYTNPYASQPEAIRPEVPVVGELRTENGVRSFTADIAAKGLRLDGYLAKALPDISRGRVQMLIEGKQVRVDGVSVKASHKLRGGERIEIEGEPQLPGLRAEPEDIPLSVVYEDKDLAVIDKPAGMMVHAGAGAAETHARGTLVNALLHRYGAGLSSGAAAIAEEETDDNEESEEVAPPQAGNNEATLRPGIVHRLDKQTSGLIVVAKNDLTHRKLGEMFAARRLRKTYLALVHGWIEDDEGTISLAIARDVIRRTRMTTRRPGGRHAISHWQVLERFEGPFGRFTLVEVRIETGRTHQIRVHMQAIGHPVVGDTLYGAPARVLPADAKKSGSQKASARVKTARSSARSEAGNTTEAGAEPVADSGKDTFSLPRNFLHAAELEFQHPRTGKTLDLASPLPPELEQALHRLRGGPSTP